MAVLSTKGQWADKSPVTTHEITAIDFIDDNIGFVGGLDTIYKTTNGGNSWTLLTVSGLIGYRIYSIDFIDANTGIAAGLNISPFGEVILKTTDGGNNWSIVHQYNDI